jgi:hypothetical protein
MGCSLHVDIERTSIVKLLMAICNITSILKNVFEQSRHPCTARPIQVILLAKLNSKYDLHTSCRPPN